MRPDWGEEIGSYGWVWKIKTLERNGEPLNVKCVILAIALRVKFKRDKHIRSPVLGFRESTCMCTCCVENNILQVKWKTKPGVGSDVAFKKACMFSSIRSVPAKDSNLTVLCNGQYTPEVCLLCFEFCSQTDDDKREHKQRNLCRRQPCIKNNVAAYPADVSTAFQSQGFGSSIWKPVHHVVWACNKYCIEQLRNKLL